MVSKASDQGSLEAKSWLGSLCLYGHGTKRDINKALEILQETAAAGDPTGATFLGMAYESGYGVPKDIEKAKGFYSQAIRRNGGRASELMGTLYLRGEGVPKDATKAAQFYTQAVLRGDDWGQLRLGDFYAAGIHVPKDTAAAAKLYMVSAQQGNKVAEFRVGELYETGEAGFVQNYQLAANYYYRSALRRHGPAELALANLFWLGQGVSRDPVRAYVWAVLAARERAIGAATQLVQMRSQMTAADLQQGDMFLKNVPSFFRNYKSL